MPRRGPGRKQPGSHRDPRSQPPGQERKLTLSRRQVLGLAWAPWQLPAARSWTGGLARRNKAEPQRRARDSDLALMSTPLPATAREGRPGPGSRGQGDHPRPLHLGVCRTRRQGWAEARSRHQKKGVRGSPRSGEAGTSSHQRQSAVEPRAPGSLWVQDTEGSVTPPVGREQAGSRSPARGCRHGQSPDLHLPNFSLCLRDSIHSETHQG